MSLQWLLIFYPLVRSQSTSPLGYLRPAIQIAMAMKVKQIFKKFGLTQKIMAYVKDESSNLATCAQALKAIVPCVDLDKAKPFDGYCFGHTLSKVCQYVTFDEKVGCGLLYASIKSTQADVQKCITWPNKSNNM